MATEPLTSDANPLRRRAGCIDLDPEWPGPDGKPRGPRVCVLYPKCKCGKEDRAMTERSQPVALASNEGNSQALADEHIKTIEHEGVLGEDAEGREGYYHPNEKELWLITDSINGLIADEDFVTQVGKEYIDRQARRAAEGACLGCGAPKGQHWGERPECTLPLEESYPGQMRDLLQMAETSIRTGFTLPDWWSPRVRALLYKPPAHETRPSPPCGSANRYFVDKRDLMDWSGMPPRDPGYAVVTILLDGDAYNPPAQKAAAETCDARDAARYRWLRHGDNDDYVIRSDGFQLIYVLRNEQLDAEIDKRRSEKAIDCPACNIGNPGVYMKDGHMVCPHRPAQKASERRGTPEEEADWAEFGDCPRCWRCAAPVITVPGCAPGCIRNCPPSPQSEGEDRG